MQIDTEREREREREKEGERERVRERERVEGLGTTSGSMRRHSTCIYIVQH